jgi:hypothetical protein
MQSANIAARAANSAKPSAKNINSVLMAIPCQQFVALHPEYLFHLVSLSSNPKLARNGRELRDRHHVLEGFQNYRMAVRGKVSPPSPTPITPNEAKPSVAVNAIKRRPTILRIAPPPSSQR